jgi:ribosomal protein L6P/L9E
MILPTSFLSSLKEVSSFKEEATKKQLSSEDFFNQDRQGLSRPKGPHFLFHLPEEIALFVCSEKPKYFLQHRKDAVQNEEALIPSDLENYKEFLTLQKAFLVLCGPRGQFTIDSSSFLPFLEVFCVVHPNSQTLQKTSFLVVTIKERNSRSKKSSLSRKRSNPQGTIWNKGLHSYQKLEAFTKILKTAIEGLTLGFTKSLRTGTPGTKFVLQDNTLFITTGISHLTGLPFPKTLVLFSENPTELTIFGINKDEVSRFAARIRYQLFKKRSYSPSQIQFDGENQVVKTTRKK